MRFIILITLCFSLFGCNSIYLKPGTLDKSQLVYAPRGGYSMQRTIKQTMEERGYNVSIGQLVRVSEVSGNETYKIPKGARYAVNVKERSEKLRPLWCIFNGFWWWSFNVSVIDRSNDSEILTWRGRGCQNSSLRKLNNVLDKLEMKETAPNPKPKQIRKKPVQPGSAVLAPQKPKQELLILAQPK